jgi:hypothetical protein
MIDFPQSLVRKASAISERELGLCLSGMTLGFAYSRAVLGDEFLYPLLLALGLWLVFSIKHLIVGSFEEIGGTSMLFFVGGACIISSPYLILNGGQISVSLLLWSLIPITIFSAIFEYLYRNHFGISVVTSISSFTVSLWLLVEMIYDERIAISFSWMFLMVISSIIHMIHGPTTTKKQSSHSIGIGIALAAVFTIYMDDFLLPWPYSGDGSLLLLSMSLGIGMASYYSMTPDSWDENVPRMSLFLVIVALIWAYWDGIWEEIVLRHHEFYHYGMFGSMAQNGIADFWNTCDNSPNHPLSEGTTWGEPNGCWLYATGQFSLPSLILMPAHSLGFTGIATYRIIGLAAFSIVLYLLYRISETRLGSRTSLLIVVFSASAPISLFWGQMLTFHQFSWLWIMAAVFFWLPVIGGEDDWEGSDFRVLHAIAFVGPLVDLTTGSAVCATMSFSLFIQSKLAVKEKIQHSLLLLFWPILGFFIVSAWTEHWFPLLGSEYLLERASVRAQSSEYLTNIDYFVRQSDWHTRMSGPVLIGLAFAGFRWSASESASSEHRSMQVAALIIISPSVLQWFLFPQTAWVHDYWVNTYIFSLSIGAAIAMKHMSSVPIKSFALFLLVLTSSVGFEDLERRQTEEFSLELQKYILDNIGDDDQVITDNSVWHQHTFKYMLPQSTIHISESNNQEHFLLAFNESLPDYIIHSNAAWEGWNSQEFLTSMSYCHEDVYTRWNLDPYTVWSPC